MPAQILFIGGLMFRSTFSGKSFAELTFYPYFNQRTTVQLIDLNVLFLFQPEDNSLVCLFVCFK